MGSGCVLSYTAGGTDDYGCWFDDAVPHTVWLTPTDIKNSASIEEQHFNKNHQHPHIQHMPTVTYSHEHSQSVLWSFRFLAHLSYTNKLTNKQTSSLCSKVACSVWSAVNLSLMNMDIYYGRLNRAMQAEQSATVLTLFAVQFAFRPV